MGRPLFYFGERCLYLPTGIMTKQAKLAPKWQKGAFAGMLEHSLEYLVITQDGTVSKCRDIKRLAQDEQFPSPLVNELRALPWKPRPGQELEEIQDAAPSHAEPDTEARQPMAPGDEHSDDVFRKFYITKRLTQKYGQTAGCAGCFLPSRTHSDNCRKRIVDEIKKDDGEMQRLRKSRPAGMERALGTTETEEATPTPEDTQGYGGVPGLRAGMPAEAAASSVKRPVPEDTEGAVDTAASSVKRPTPDNTTRAVNTTTTKRAAEVEPEDPATIERDRLRFEEGRDLFEQVATAARAAGKAVQQADYYQDGEWDMDGLTSDRVIYGQRMAIEEGGLSTVQFAIELNEEKQESFGEVIVRELYSQCDFVDEYTGMPLPQELVLAARAEELDDYQNMEVFREVPTSEAYAVTGKPPISCRWIDLNKGDQQRMKVRSRLVAREIKPKGVESVFTSTPPWGAFRYLLSCLASDRTGTKKIAILDIKRAFKFFTPNVDNEALYNRRIWSTPTDVGRRCAQFMVLSPPPQITNIVSTCACPRRPA
eukprot:3065173-Amphidinium_carterae.1